MMRISSGAVAQVQELMQELDEEVRLEVIILGGGHNGTKILFFDNDKRAILDSG